MNGTDQADRDDYFSRITVKRGSIWSACRRYAKGAYTIWYRDVVGFRRDWARVISALGMPLLYLLVFGTGIATAMSGVAGSGVDFRQFMFPGILAMTIMFTSIFSAISIIWDREFGLFKEVMIAPIPRVAIALGKIAGSATIALLQGSLLLLIAPVLGIELELDQLVALLCLMGLLAAVMTSLGILIAARQRSMEGFQLLTQFLLMPMFFLSGALFPLRGVPWWLEALGQVNPVTYAVDALRQVALRNTVSEAELQAIALHPVASDVAVLVVLGVLFIVPGVWLFCRQE